MTPDAIGAGTIKRLAELRTGGAPTLSVYLDLDTETLSSPALSLVAVAAALDDLRVSGGRCPRAVGGRRSTGRQQAARRSPGFTPRRSLVGALAPRAPHITGRVWAPNGGQER